tara:strand:- start:268733 stop:269125 length:393 start_codon:yes stop_codon:yes gene_type:complete
MGFVDADAARRAVRRLKLRSALGALHTSVPTLLDVLDQRPNADAGADPAARQGGIGLASGDHQSGIGGGSIDCVKRDDMREQELLEGVNLALQLLDTLGVGLRHGLFSAVAGTEGKQAAEDGHCLSEVAK